MMRETATAPTDASAGAVAWRLFGIVRRDALDVLPDVSPALRGLACGPVAAVTGPVPLAEFDDATLRERVQRPGELAALASEHHAMIDAIHRLTPILPAKFGGVYAQVDDLLAAVEWQREPLAARLDLVAGCDEWAARVYLDRERIRDQTIAADPELCRLREDLEGASPGRAYLLQRRLDDALARATEPAVVSVARECAAWLERGAVASRFSPLERAAAGRAGELEALRADLLVRRERFEAFVAGVDQLGERHPELRCELSGPWPPYSFATPEEPDPDGEGAA